ncbi:methyltransferase domain-containing protein [Nonlabens agnitus]|uniref:Methyltransferase n=1 Tax=Nonlabens agnitus TaxID=870484 RepID=A0A2S9WU43_9FLAO|nr:hypothetical protein [Nonlabens agnitus]PRP67002.1 hypothetical protein BST86_07765 [Nonlabens agnitus]
MDIVNNTPYLYDKSGRILVTNDTVYRIIEKKDKIDSYLRLLRSDNIFKLYNKGLIETKIVEEKSNTNLLVLEHKYLPFILHPAEYTCEMYWQAARQFIELNQECLKVGFVTYDAHPYNITFYRSNPVFYDFGSLIQAQVVSIEWFQEFWEKFVIPIWLSSFSKKTFKFSKELRKEHQYGFGTSLLTSSFSKKLLFRKFLKLVQLRESPELLFNEILKWLDDHRPIPVSKQYWSNYYKGEEFDLLTPQNMKERFCLEIFQNNKYDKVVDLASNKGYFSEMAEYFGAEVLSFDYEEEVVNSLLKRNKVTAAHIDFNIPTPALGVSLFWGDMFSRLQGDLVIALGLIHHICIRQKTPVYLFCQTCLQLASKGILLEFVYMEDKHVKQWNEPKPQNYDIETIGKFFSPKFTNRMTSKLESADGLKRRYIYFFTN